MNLIPKVKKYSQHKSSLFTVRDKERKTFNISISKEDKVSEIKIKYDNISSLDPSGSLKVVQHPSIARNTIFLRPQRKPTIQRNIYLNGMQKKERNH